MNKDEIIAKLIVIQPKLDASLPDAYKRAIIAMTYDVVMSEVSSKIKALEEQLEWSEDASPGHI